MTWNFISPYQSVVIGKKGTWEQVWLISYRIVVAVDIILGDIVEEIKIVTARPIIIVNIVLNVDIRRDKVSILFF